MEKVEPKTETENIKVDTNGGKEDKDVEIVLSTKKIVEIELSSSDEEKNGVGVISTDELLPDLKSVSLNTNDSTVGSDAEPLPDTKLEVHYDGKPKKKPHGPFKFIAHQVKNENDDDEDWIKVVSPDHFNLKSEENSAVPSKEDEIGQEENVIDVKSEEVAVKSEDVIAAKCEEVTHEATFHISYKGVDTTVKDELENFGTVQVKSEETIANEELKTEDNPFPNLQVKCELDGNSETPSEGNDSDYGNNIKLEVKDEDEENISDEVKYEVKDEVKDEVMGDITLGNGKSATDGSIIRGARFVVPLTEDNRSVEGELRSQPTSEGNKIFHQSYGQTFDSVTGTSLNVHRQEVRQEPKGQATVFVAFSLKTQNRSHVNKLQSFSQTSHTVLGTSVKLQSKAVLQHPVCQTSVFGTFTDKTNVCSEVSTFHESSTVVDGSLIEGSTKARPSLSDDSTSKDDPKKREIKSLIPDYNSDQSLNVDSKSNLSTEEL